MRFSYTEAMKHEFEPTRLPVAAFAREEQTHAGEEKLARFERLLEESRGLGGESWVSYSVQGSLRADAAGVDEPWLHLSASATLSLICQRCLNPMDVRVEFARDFRFVASEDLAAVEDEESEEDVLVLSKAFNLLELIEDELLMALPPAPKHTACPQPVKFQVADAGFDAQPTERANPFAVLAQLKKKDG